MKSKKILWFILIGVVVILVAGAGVIFAADSGETKRQKELNDNIARNEALLARGLTEKTAKQNEQADLEKQLSEAKKLLAGVDFPEKAESIEYDRILFEIARSNGLQVSSINATAALDLKEGDITYQQTTFAVTVEGLPPGILFQSPQDSTFYINGVVNNILAYVNTIAESSDFKTAQMPTVNISVPAPMTQEEIEKFNEQIMGLIEKSLTEEETEGKTEEQIALLVQSKLVAKSATEIAILMDEAGLSKPSAVITIKIWTYKGAN